MVNWHPDADQAMARVPFFIRKKVRKRLEDYVREENRSTVTLWDVSTLKKKFLSKGGMASEIKGYSVTTCFGQDKCPNQAFDTGDLARDIEKLLQKADILGFLKSNVTGDLKFHHEFRVTLSDCPNACSRPQISDIGIIGAREPMITDMACSQCMACVSCCDESAVALESDAPVIDLNACVLCGKCIEMCPTGTLVEKERGFRVLAGGRLGRHPRLGMEIPGLFQHRQVLDLVQSCVTFYKTHSTNGQRFAHLLKSLDQLKFE